MREKQLVLYRNVPNEDILTDMVSLYETYEMSGQKKNGGQEAEEAASDKKRKDTMLFYDVLHRILDLSVSHGFYGNLWHCFLASILTGHENAYSISCELTGTVVGSIHEAALHDFQIFHEFFAFDLSSLFGELKISGMDFLLNYEGNGNKSKVFNTRIRDHICETAVKMAEAGDAETLKSVTTQFYAKYGVGKFGLHKAFRMEPEADGIHAAIVPVLNIAHVHLDDLVGYEIAKKKTDREYRGICSGKKGE